MVTNERRVTYNFIFVINNLLVVFKASIDYIFESIILGARAQKYSNESSAHVSINFVIYKLTQE